MLKLRQCCVKNCTVTVAGPLPVCELCSTLRYDPRFYKLKKKYRPTALKQSVRFRKLYNACVREWSKDEYAKEIT